MKHLGIDFGSKRVGLAISDDGGSLAFPLEVLSNDDKLVLNIKKIVEDNNIEKIVIGESKDFQMKENKIMAEARQFSEDLKKEISCDIVFQPEFMTSMQVEREHFQISEMGKKRGYHKVKDVDAKAATIILQSYLDSY
ncbi:Holliday junction resolvase RuvX [Candidatus Nomurabacteria bacterium]|nr:Holliday junction resolvase RuvX [Candidatus Nomurabacteria bacterium]